MNRRHGKNGFTLIELLVVIAIIGLLSSVVAASLNTARTKGQIGRAQADLHNLAIAVQLLGNDTGALPYPTSAKPSSLGCATSPDINEVYADQPQAGIVSTDGNFPGWNGPYMDLPKDPWGVSYQYDEDYYCNASPLPVGCAGTVPTKIYRAVLSSGPNKSAINAYDSDDIVQILCAH